MLFLLLSLALAHDFAELPSAAPELPATPDTASRQALQLLMLPFMQDRERFATLARVASEPRSPEVDAVFLRCDAALKDGVRPREVGYTKAAKRQAKGAVADCMDAAHALAEAQGVIDRKLELAEIFGADAGLPRFGIDACPSLLSGVAFPTPATPAALAPHDGERFASVVVLVQPSGDAVVKGRLYGDEAASRACWAAVDGPWTPATDADGSQAASCFHHRCDFR